MPVDPFAVPVLSPVARPARPVEPTVVLPAVGSRGDLDDLGDLGVGPSPGDACALGEPFDGPLCEPLDAADDALLVSLPDDPAALEWPSQVWHEHLTGCERPRRCPHVVPLPEWWWARMRKAALPLAADPREAVEEAMRRINRYRGGKQVSPEGAAFTRDAARDALPAAEQPVTHEWVNQTLACVGALATWVHNEGEPLTRQHVFAPSTVARYLDGPDGATHLSKYTARNYRLRYDKLKSVLLGSQREVITGRNPAGRPDAMTPLTRQQEADLWVWSQGLRPISVRHRVQAVIVCGLGVGVRRREFAALRAGDVISGESGVQVALQASLTSRRTEIPARVVTCAAQWEQRLLVLVAGMGPDEFVGAPGRTDATLDPKGVDATLRLVMNNESAAPPVLFSSDSLRNTWLLRHLEAGTPLRLLREQGGFKSMATIEKLVPLAEPATGEAATRFMRMTERGGHI